MKILLLSAYDADSHRYWREGLAAHFTQHDWTVLSLPARHFAWRVRGNSLTWAFSEREVLEGHYDLLIATSMCDLSALRGMAPKLAGIPSLLYFHENQFAYPTNAGRHGNVEPQLLSIYSAACANALVFNSEYNRRSFFSGAKALLTKLPDGIPKQLLAQLEAQSRVLPVPLCTPENIPARQESGPLSIVWNHRWEYDKGPQLLLAIAKRLIQDGMDFRLHVVGQQFRKQPESFAKLRKCLGDSIGQWGYLASRSDYRALLQSSDVVLSTALHDFQGLSVLEATQAGCVPVVPNRLAYPEWFGPDYCYAAGSIDEESEAAAQLLLKLAGKKARGQMPAAPDLSHLEWAALGEHYGALMAQLAGA